MQCRHCGSPVNILDRSCSHCGKSLSLLDEGPQDKADSLLDAVSAVIEAEIFATEKAIFQELISGGDQKKRLPSWRLGTLPPPATLRLLETDSFRLETTNAELQQVAGFTFNSPHVQANYLYRERAAQTSLIYLPGVDIVNASATDRPINGIDIPPPLIAVFGGLTHATRIASIGLGLDQSLRTGESRKLFVAIIHELGKSIVENQGKLALKDITEISERLQLELRISDSEVLRRANSYTFAMNLAVISHELGHICLGHTLGFNQNMEISRNQERQADLFSASVASASPFSDYIVAGGIFWWVILTWVHAAAGAHMETTHPNPRERLMDYIRSNREQAAALKIDEQSIAVFLPKE